MSISRGIVPFILALCASAAVAADPPKPKTDLYGDPLPDKAVMRLGTVKYRLPGVAGMAFKKSGELVVLAGELELHTFPADGGPKPIVTRVVDEPPAGVSSVAISPDAKYVAAYITRRKELKVWDISGAKPELYHSRNFTTSARVGFSPDGRWLWMCDWQKEDGEGAPICDLATREWKPLPLPKKVRAWQAEFTADGGRVLLRDEGDLRVFDTATGEVVVNRKISSDERGAAFSPDGKVLAWVPSNRTFNRQQQGTFASVADGKEVKGWTPPTVRASWCGFTPGGKTLWVSDDHTLREWDPDAGKWLREAPVSVDYRYPVWSADGKRMACVDGGTLVFLDPDTWKVRNADAVNAGPTGTIYGVAVSPDGKVIATHGRVVGLWDAATGKLLGRVNSMEEWGANVAFLPDSKSFLMVPKPDEIAECDARTGKELRRFKTADDLKGRVELGYLRLSADGKELSTFARGYTIPPGDNRLRWDVSTGEETARFKSPTGRLESEYHRIRSPDDRWLALGGVLYRIEDYPDKKPVEVLDRQSCTGSRSCWSTDSTLVTFGKEKKGKERERSAECSLIVYNADKLAVQTELPTGWVSEAVFSKDNKFLGVVTPDAVAVWDVAAGKRVFRVECPNGGRIAFVPDGKRLITDHGPHALVWDISAATGR